MRRRTFTFLSAVSLAIFAAALMLGTRSYWKLDYLTFYPNPEHQICCCTRNGLIDLSSSWRVVERRGGPWGLPPGYAVGPITADSGSVWKLMPYRRRYDEDQGRTITEYQFLGFDAAWGYYRSSATELPHDGLSRSALVRSHRERSTANTLGDSSSAKNPQRNRTALSSVRLRSPRDTWAVS